MRIATPEMADCQKGETSMTGSALKSTTRNAAPSRHPATLPRPPRMLTPPMTQAAMVCSSKPSAVSV